MSAANTKMLLRSIRVDRSQIGYLKWLLESHEGIATQTTRDGTDEVIDLLVAPDFEKDLDDLIAALSEEIAVETVGLPEKPPLGG